MCIEASCMLLKNLWFMFIIAEIIDIFVFIFKVVSDGGKRPFRWDKISLFAGARFRQFILKISSSGVQLPIWRKLIPGISCEVNFLPHWTPPHTGLIFFGIIYSRKIEILYPENCNKPNKLSRVILQNWQQELPQ